MTCKPALALAAMSRATETRTENVVLFSNGVSEHISAAVRELELASIRSPCWLGLKGPQLRFNGPYGYAFPTRGTGSV